MNKDTRRLAGVSALAGIGMLVFVLGPLPLAEGLYRAGLWPRLTPEEVRQQLSTLYRRDLPGCSRGVNGWDYVCELPSDPKRPRPYDKVAVMGSVFGIGSLTDLPPGPLPDRAAYEAEARARSGRAGQRQRFPIRTAVFVAALVVLTLRAWR